MTKKTVLAVDVRDEKEKQKAMNAVTSLSGVDSLSMDMNEKKLTVIGCVDPVEVVRKLRKKWPHTKILTVGLAKEPEEAKSNDEDDKKVVEVGNVLPLSEYTLWNYPYYLPYVPCYAM